ncbi:MAG: response regulator, partial [Proteobacteria bacterium]|nr:response regulator [Pseudomonadota bacterium]
MSVPVVIVDDEPPARAKLRRLLAEADGFEVAAEAGDVESAVAAVRATGARLLFLDIQLGARSGFDVLEAIRGDAAPVVVFTTAYSEHAVRAFELQ